MKPISDKQEVVVICEKYDIKKVTEIQRLNAYEQFFDNCSLCGGRVMMAASSREFMDKDQSVKPVCIECFAGKIKKQGIPEIVRLPKSTGEINSYLTKKYANKN